MTDATTHTYFSDALLAWYDRHGRKDLPWQTPRDPYRVWVSEIMLQQTQVQTVIPYFNRFMDAFPTIMQLARADEDAVLALWSGLGYYSRARHLHKTAHIITQDFNGAFPRHLDILVTLPGIGPSTAAAILSQAFNLPTAILDANVIRVLSRFFKVEGLPARASVKNTLWEHAHACMPQTRCAEYTQAIMDLGALCCTAKKPNCPNCPLNTRCLALKDQEPERYPTKKTKKTIPVQKQQFLVLQDLHGMVYLEKRPPSGVWGGLWCLPSIEIHECAFTFIRQSLALYGESAVPLMAFKHRFSHFLLEINAVHIKTRPLHHQNAHRTGQWFTRDQLSTLGLAKPTHRILMNSLE